MREVIGVIDYPVIVYSYETDRIIAMSSRAVHLAGGEIQQMNQLWEERKKQRIPGEVLSNGSFLLYGKHILHGEERLEIDAEFSCIALEQEHMIFLIFEQSYKMPFAGSRRYSLPRLIWRDKRLRVQGTNTIVRDDCDVRRLEPDYQADDDMSKDMEEAMEVSRKVIKEGVGRYETLHRATINRTEQSFAKFYRIPLINKYRTCTGVLTLFTLILDPVKWQMAKDEIYRANYILGQAIAKAGVFAVTWKSGPEGYVDFISNNVREWGYRPEQFYSGELTWRDLVVSEEYECFQEKNVKPYAYASHEKAFYYHIRKKDGDLLMIRDVTIQMTLLGNQSYRQGILEVIAEPQSQTDLVPLLKKAAENDIMMQFSVYFQPIIDGDTGRFAGCEALLRWYHETYGFMNPAEFIPVSEYLGYIEQFGELVFTEAFSLCQEWNQKGFEDYKVHINLSAMQLLQKETQEQIRKIHLKTKVKASNIVFEVKESLASEGIELMRAVLQSLRAQGFQILLDDFGSGMSSLDLVTEIPLDYIKVDETYIGEYGTDRFHPDFLSAVVELAHKLGIKVIVSGIETREQRDFLLLSDIDYYQGYYYGRPIPRKEMEALIMKEASR